VDERRKHALVKAVTEASPGWSEEERHAVAALLDVLWNLPSHLRLVEAWGFGGEDAAQAITWIMGKVIAAVEADDRPPGSTSR
jgi:hypothetical protein